MRQAFSQLLSGSSRATDWMAGQIAHVCRTFGPRSPGSPGERAAAEHMAALLEREGGCPAALVESFREHPAAFYGYFRFSMALDVLTCAGFFLRPWLSLVFGSLALGLFVFKFLLYWPVIDGLFPAREGTNVTAVRPCRGTVERRVFVNGHVDAAWEFPLN